MKLYGHHWHPSGSPSPRPHPECSYTAMRIYFPKPRAAPFLSAEQPSGLTNTDAPEPTHRQLRPDPAGSPCPRPHTQSAGLRWAPAEPAALPGAGGRTSPSPWPRDSASPADPGRPRRLLSSPATGSLECRP